MGGAVSGAHHTTHENGGSDEISVADLTGLLATAQTPAAHKVSHQSGGSDAIDVTGLAGLPAAAIYPWMIDIDIFMTPKSIVNWANKTIDTQYYHSGRNYSSGTLNDSIAWDVVLGAGTWTVELIHHKDSARGIYSIQFDGVEKGTIDGYDAGSSINHFSSVTGIVVATSAKIELKLKMASKNGSSSNYYGDISGLRLIRTS